MPLILLNKPYRVLCQFTDDRGRATLAECIDVPSVYPAGRLDYESEGLTLLTDDGRLQARISQPQGKLDKHYWVQVDGAADAAQVSQLLTGVILNDGPARALAAALIDAPPGLWERDPPIRVRRNIPTSWLSIVIAEGRNRQVRRMTAAVGLPALRLLRHRIGPWQLDALRPGESLALRTDVAWKRLQAYTDATTA